MPLSIGLLVLQPASAQPSAPKVRFTQHDYNRYNIVTKEEISTLRQIPNTAALTPVGFGGGLWEVTTRMTPVIGDPMATDYVIGFKLKSGRVAQSSVGIQIEVPNWSVKNYVLLPAAAYNGNRFESRRIAYSPKLLDPKDIGPEKPTIVSDIPRLNINDGPSRIQEKTGSMSTPCLAYYDSLRGESFYLLTHQTNELGDYGIEIEESRDRKTAFLRVTTPGVRELYKYRITDMRFASDDRGKDWSAGDSVTIRYRMVTRKTENLNRFFEEYVPLRKMLVNGTRPNTVSYSQAFEVQQKKYNEQNWVSDFGYYAIGMRENFLQDWQIGWTGGMISTYPLLAEGSALSRERVIKNFQWLFNGGIAPSGYFYDSGEKGNLWYGGDIRKPNTANWHLTRKGGDGLYYVLKQLMLMPRLKITPEKKWEDQTKGVADAFVKTFKKYGQIGQFVDSRTGDVTVGGSASGAIVPGALALAAQYYKNPEYLKVAKDLFRLYQTQYLNKGIMTGGPGDAMQNNDSESTYAFLESAVTLYEATGDVEYLSAARQCLVYFSTWVSSYDYKFPPQSLFGRTGMRSMGAVWANTQNKHGAPAICTFSGQAIWKYYRATSDPFALELLTDIMHNATQYLGHPLRPIEGVKDGWMCERVSTNDWLEGIGEITYKSTWAEISVMLGWQELPGLYIDLVNGNVANIDHVDYKVLENSAKQFRIEVSNPTKGALTLKLMAENAAVKAKPLGPLANPAQQVINLKVGEKKVLTFKK